MSQALAPVIERIASFAGLPRNLQLVSRTWYESLSENDRNMIEGIQKKYPDLKSLYSVYILAVRDNDVDTIRKLAFEYSGFLPYRWSLGIPYINSREMFNIIWIKSEVLNLLLKKKAYQYGDDDIIRGIRDKKLEKAYCRKIPTREDLFDKDSLICLSIEEIESLINNYPGFGPAELKRMIEATGITSLGYTLRSDILDWILLKYGAAAFGNVRSAGIGYWEWYLSRNIGVSNAMITALANDNPVLASLIPDNLLQIIYQFYKPNLYSALRDRVNNYILALSAIFQWDTPILPYIKNAIISDPRVMLKYFDDIKGDASIDLVSEALDEYIKNGYRGNNIMKYINYYNLIEALDEHINMHNAISLLFPLDKFGDRMRRYLSMKGMHPEWYEFIWSKDIFRKPADISDQFLEFAISNAIKRKDNEASKFIARFIKLSTERKLRFRKFAEENLGRYETEIIMLNLQ